MAGAELDEAELRPSRLRLVVCYAAIAAALPYLVLKLLWLGGSTVGITDPRFAEDGSLFALNLLTLVMDVVAIALALAFTFPWGQRLPAWLLLFPIWVGTGFLGPIIVAVPVTVVLETVGDGSGGAASSGLPLADWVVPLVYGGFTVLGVLLMTAFVLYARVRWFEVFSDRTPELSRGELVLAVAGTLLALATAAVQVSFALSTSAQKLSAIGLWSVHALFALAAAAAVWAMRPVGVRRFRVPMLLAWAGSGGMVAWGFWSLVNTLGGTALVTRETDPVAVVGASAQLLGGLLLAAVLAVAARRVTGAAAPV